MEKSKTELETFPLSALCFTQKGNFDMRKNVTKDYLHLCEKAGVNPLEYYEVHHGSKSNSKPDHVKKTGSPDMRYKGNKEEDAREKLKKFELSTPKLTETGQFDNRLKSTKEYLDLCKEAGVVPLDYYKTHYHPPGKGTSSVPTKVSGSPDMRYKENKQEDALQELRKFKLSTLKLTESGQFDNRLSSTKEYIDLCKAAGVVPLEYYHKYYHPAAGSQQKINSQKDSNKQDQAMQELRKFKLSALRLTESGRFDNRLKSTKEYIDLCKAAGVIPLEYYNKFYHR